MAASFKVQSADDVTQITQDLLAKLHDPYTRLLQSDEDTALAAEEEGKVMRGHFGGLLKMERYIFAGTLAHTSIKEPPLCNFSGRNIRSHS